MAEIRAERDILTARVERIAQLSEDEFASWKNRFAAAKKKLEGK